MKFATTMAGAVLGVAALTSSAAFAAPVTLQVCHDTTMCWNGSYTIADNVPVDWAAVELLDNSNGTSVSEWDNAHGLTVSDWSMTLDSDPFVTNNFTITNNTTSTQTYTMTATVGVSPAIASGLMRGSVGLTLTDNDGNGASLANATGASVYKALIDGNSARTLWDNPFSFSVLAIDGTGTTNTKFGFPTREGAPESVDTAIGITISFTLSPQDSVAFTSNFDVVPVPLPAAAWLFGSGLLGLAAAARRKGR